MPAREASSDAEVAAFIAKMKAIAPAAGGERGRLVFAMDATMSRAPTWDMALALQGDMFAAVKEVGGLDVQLIYFRGLGECRASKWVSDPDALARLMRGVGCEGGLTQIGKRADATRSTKAAAAQGQRARLCRRQHGGERRPAVRARRRARRCSACRCSCSRRAATRRPGAPSARSRGSTKGAFCRFDPGSARQLRDLLTAVAVYAAGGRKALLALSAQE